MLLLATQAEPQMVEHTHPNLARLAQLPCGLDAVEPGGVLLRRPSGARRRGPRR